MLLFLFVLFYVLPNIYSLDFDPCSIFLTALSLGTVKLSQKYFRSFFKDFHTKISFLAYQDVVNQFVVKVDGNVFVVYNLGSSDTPIGEMGVKVNDGNYHVIRFTRSGQNSTLQIDDYQVSFSEHAEGAI